MKTALGFQKQLRNKVPPELAAIVEEMLDTIESLSQQLNIVSRSAEIERTTIEAIKCFLERV